MYMNELFPVKVVGTGRPVRPRRHRLRLTPTTPFAAMTSDGGF